MTGAENGHPRDRLSEYLDDALEIETREMVDRHLAECADCRAELDALWYLASAVSAEKVPPVPSELAAKIGRRLDEATVARPRFRRYLVPASIAATIGAVGLLVALQWRQGRFEAPADTQPARVAREYDELKTADARSTPAAPGESLPAQPVPEPAKEVAPTASLEKDLKQDEGPALEEELGRKKAEAAPSDVEPGVVGGVVGGIQGGAESGVAQGVAGGVPGGAARSESDASSGGARQRAATDDARRDAAAKTKVPAAFAPAPATAPPLAKANAAGESPCMDRWSDSGVRGSWGVPDIDAAMKQLGRVAHAVDGIGFWRGVAEGRPYVVVVPRVHFEEVFYALRARGVAGLNEAPALAEGTDCTGISITLTLVPDSQAPPAPGR